MIFLDTGYFVALFTPDDRLHERAAAWSLQLNEPTLVTEYILWECVNAFSRPKDRASAHALMAQIQSDPDCELIHASLDLFSAGLQLHRARPDKEWSLTDCISFVVMQKERIREAVTGDKHFEQAGFVALLK